MASKSYDLRKYSYKPSSSTRPDAALTSSSTDTPAATPLQPEETAKMDAEALKNYILLSLKAEIAQVIKPELKNALTEDFSSLKCELQTVREEMEKNTIAIRSELDTMKATVKEMEGELNSCSDEVTALRTPVSDLKAEVKGLREKCEDMEGRLRRCNIRILGVAETSGSCSTALVSKLLKEALHLDKDVLVDRSHRSGPPRRSDGKPCAIVAQLHYYQDCVEVLKRAHTRTPIQFNEETITIFLDYTASVVKARAAFTDVRKLLRNHQGVRYGIMFPAKLRITHNGEKKEFTDAVKAMAYVKKNIAQTEV